MKKIILYPAYKIALVLILILLAGTKLFSQQSADFRTSANTPHLRPKQLLLSGGGADTTAIVVEPVQNTNWTPDRLVREVFLGTGSCAIVSNVIYTGDTRSVGYFKRNPNNPSFPLKEGIILSTGKVSDAIGPNNVINITTEMHTPGDVDIAKIAAPHISYDAAVLTFDFVPSTTSMTFRYIFASDEYPQWSCSQYNDMFGFFVSGPGISPDPAGFADGAKNIALLQDGVTPVTINNIRAGGWNQYTHTGPNPSCPDLNAEYYVAVPAHSTSIEYDGRTVVLSATIHGLTPCATYRIKFAIADVSDRRWDSAVFLEALSFDTGSDIQFKNLNFKGLETSTIFRNCNQNTLRIERTNGNLENSEEITYTVSGTAVYGTHHTLQGGTVTIPVGQSFVEIPYSILDNPIPGGSATIVVETITGCLCDPNPVIESQTINIYDSYSVSNLSSTNPLSCITDDYGTITVELSKPTAKFDYYFTFKLIKSSDEATQIYSTQNTTHTFSGLSPGRYSIEITDNATCALISLQDIVIIEEEAETPTLSVSTSGIITCANQEVTLSATSDGTVEWFIGETVVGSGLTYITSNPGILKVVARSEKGCISSKTLEVKQNIDPPAVAHDPIAPVCANVLPLILGQVSGSGVYSGAEVSVVGENYIFSAPAPGEYTVRYTVTAENGCSGQIDIQIVVHPATEVTLSEFENLCSESAPIKLTGGFPQGGVYTGAGVDEQGFFDPSLAGEGEHIILYTFTNPETGCFGQAQQTIKVNTPVLKEVLVQDVSCHEGADGKLSILTYGDNLQSLVITGPAFNYTSGKIIQTVFNDLTIGTYNIEATSTDGCAVTKIVQISQPDPLTITLAELKNVTYQGGSDGAIKIGLSGGNSVYNVLWNNYANNTLLESLPAGIYSVTVTDSKNCTAKASYEIIVDHSPSIIDLAVTVEVNIATPNPAKVDNVIFALVVTNSNKKYAATGVVVENVIPYEFPFIHRLDDGTSGNFDPATRLWQIGTIPAGGHVILVYRTGLLLEAKQGKSFAVNSGKILPFDQTDPNLLNNYAEVVVSVGESTSADDNGIESNGNMASQLALRNHRRLLDSRHIQKDERKTSMVPYSRSQTAMGMIKSAILEGKPTSGIQMLLPETGPANTRAFVSTPGDLLNITNATEIFAVDYLQENNSRRAAILAISTKYSEVYEHTKVICDRLTGAELRDIRLIEIAGRPFIMSKLVHPNGYVDYSTSFVAQRKGSDFVIDTRWNNAEYSIIGNDDIYNFQVWSVAPQFTQTLVEDILSELSSYDKLEFLNEKQKPLIPQVYVRSGRYAEGGLLLNLVNKSGADQITLTGNVSRYENGNREPFSISIKIPVAEYSDIFVPTGYIFDAGFSITNNKGGAADVLYYADGAWMFDFDPGFSRVTQFATTPESRPQADGSLIVERSASFSGQVRTYSSLFRSLAPTQAPVSLQEYDMIEFEASGVGNFEIMLAKAGIHSWNEQYRSYFTLNHQPQKFAIKFGDLANKDGERSFIPDDVVSIVFNALGAGNVESEFELNIQNLRFTNSQLTLTPIATSMSVFPNPFTQKTQLQLKLAEPSHVKVEILNTMGQTIEILQDKFMETGDYQIEWQPALQSPGLYMMRIVAGDQTHTFRLVYKN